jgi:16S rRNA (guanine527-N7)-methyltransferase
MVHMEAYAELLRRWQGTTNLVSQRSLDDLWRRHFLDSAQLAQHAPDGAHWLDLGSGAGFPGLVLAIMGARVTLVESDQRKCTFLREVVRLSGAAANIVVRRIEDPPPAMDSFDVITARALAPLDRLIALAGPWAGLDTVGLFPKGQDVDIELTRCAKYRRIRFEKLPSITNPAASIVRVEGLYHGQ